MSTKGQISLTQAAVVVAIVATVTGTAILAPNILGGTSSEGGSASTTPSEGTTLQTTTGNSCTGNEDCKRDKFCDFSSCNAMSGKCTQIPKNCPPSKSFDFGECKGDLNSDGIINVNDTEIFAREIVANDYDLENSNIDRNCADFNSDGTVDDKDFICVNMLLTDLDAYEAMGCPQSKINNKQVCGCDGITYSSDCERKKARVALNHTGVCGGYCGDGVCSGAETKYSCPEDCDSSLEQTCAQLGGTICSLNQECVCTPDGPCKNQLWLDASDTDRCCSQLCFDNPFCGNGFCDIDNDENYESCPEDCEEVPEIECTDTDPSDDIYVKGVLTGIPYWNQTKSITTSDTCTSLGQLKQFHCENNFIRTSWPFTDCPDETICVEGRCTETYTTEGGEIYHNGEVWHGKGVAKMSVFGGGPGEAKAIGANVVREIIDVKMTPTTKLREIADDAKDNDQVVIFTSSWYDCEGVGGSTPSPACKLNGRNPQEDPRWDAIEARWREIAAEFKNDSHVWFILWAEPYWSNSGYSDEMWYDDAVAMISNVRDQGADNIILLGGTDTQQGYGVLLTKGPAILEQFDNIVFDIHAYGDSWFVSTNEMVSRINKLKQIAPVIIGDFGAGGDSTNYPQVIEAAEETNVPAIAWSWHRLHTNIDVNKYQEYGQSILEYLAGHEDITCVDSDATALNPGGYVPEVKGTANWGGITNSEYCTDGKLMEFYCNEEGYMASSLQDCPDGCAQAACK